MPLWPAVQICLNLAGKRPSVLSQTFSGFQLAKFGLEQGFLRHHQHHQHQLSHETRKWNVPVICRNVQRQYFYPATRPHPNGLVKVTWILQAMSTCLRMRKSDCVQIQLSLHVYSCLKPVAWLWTVKASAVASQTLNLSVHSWAEAKKLRITNKLPERALKLTSMCCSCCVKVCIHAHEFTVRQAGSPVTMRPRTMLPPPIQTMQTCCVLIFQEVCPFNSAHRWLGQLEPLFS